MNKEWLGDSGEGTRKKFSKVVEDVVLEHIKACDNARVLLNSATLRMKMRAEIQLKRRRMKMVNGKKKTIRTRKMKMTIRRSWTTTTFATTTSKNTCGARARLMDGINAFKCQ